MRSAIFAILFLCTLAVRGQVAAGRYKIYDTRLGKPVQLEQLLAAIQHVQVVFFGEEHNDSTGHALEHLLLREMTARWPGTALSLEMFQTDTQVTMDEYLAGLISEKNFIKDARVWSNYADYRPMIEWARTNKLRVIAANTPTRYSNAVTMGGLKVLQEFPQASRRYLPPLPVDTATGAYHQKFLDELGGHGMGSMKVYQTQNLWDSSMAWSVANFLKQYPAFKVLHLNGRFHSDQKLGAYAKLARYAPQLKALNISCFAAGDFAQPDWKQYSKLGDFVILTDPEVKKTF